VLIDCFQNFSGFITLLEVVSIRLRRTEAQWSANICGGLPREAGFASILLHLGASQASDKCSSARMYGGLRFLDRPALVEHISFLE
jgi:hypothetical protein